MKKNLFTKLLAMLMIAALTISAAGCGNSTQPDESAAQIAVLEQENAALKQQIQELTAEIERMKQVAALQTWTMNAEAWKDGNGATVTFSAIPVNYVEGQRAALSVRMGDLEAEGTNCIWDGNAFTGSVELSALDGYSYYCILTSADGSQEEIELNSPDNITNEALVYLGSNLTAYANLVVENWEATDAALTVTSGYAQVQLPRLSASASDVASAALVLVLNGTELERQSLTMPAGEGEGSYELTLTGNSFSMPAMEDDYQLELQLQVSLSNGSTISVSGCSWFYNNGELIMVVG